MVSRRKAARFLWSSARRALANLCGSRGGWFSRTDLSEFHQLGGSQLVAGRQLAGLRRKFPQQSGFIGLCARSKDAKARKIAGLGWLLFSTLVSRRSLHRR